VTIQNATLLCGGAFTNQGTVTLLAGSTNRMTGGGMASGTFDVSSGSLVEWSTASFLLDPSAQLNGAGLYRINNATLTRNADLMVTNLDLVLGTLTVNGIVTIGSAMNWNGGTMSGSGRTIIPPGAMLNMANPGSLGLNRTLENGGTALWTGAGSLVLNNSTFTNRTGALFHAQNAAAISGNGSARFDNAGTFRKSANPGIASSIVSFNNFGTVEIQTGTLNLSGGGTNSGSFDVALDTTLNLSAGTYSAGPSSRITGAGNLSISGATANLGGLVNLAGSNTFSGISGTTANLTGNYICTNNTLMISGATTANFNGTGTVAPANIALLRVGNGNPTLGGNNTVTVLGQMDWTGGTMSGSGRTIIEPAATLNLANPSAIVLNRTLENGGTVLWSGAGSFALNNCTLTNRAGALFHAQNAIAISFGGGTGRFDNAGLFRKSATNGTTTIASGIAFTNYGTVEIRRGILAANGGYASSSNALLNCALGGTAAGTNYGQLQVAGTVNLNSALSVDFVNGFVPALNDSFTVVTAGTRSGTFANFLYPSNALTMQMSNTPTAVIIRVTDFLTAIPQPTLLSPEISGANFKLTWTAVSNTIYRVEFTPNLVPSNWTTLPGDVTAFTNTASKLDPLTSSNRLYRVRIVP
jgi:hypothetical protein